MTSIKQTSATASKSRASTTAAKGFAAQSATTPLAPFSFERRAGCMVDSCRTCPDCKAGLEQYCQVGMTLTYNSPEKQTGLMTYGGYSDKIVVDQDFVLRVPDRLDPAGAAPLLCAGITMYSHFGTGR
jgi:hypothetical protein